MSRTTHVVRKIRPQKGPQEAFLSSSADFVLFGGAAGGGKTYALLMDPLRWIKYPQFRAVFFRRTFAQIKQGGGPWDTARDLYAPLGARFANLTATFPHPNDRYKAGARVAFTHLERRESVIAHDGAQYSVVYFDELMHFDDYQFWYLMSRLRTLAPMKPYMRATTNPTSPDHWLYHLVKWWIGPEGFPDPTRIGKVRWFVRAGDELIWGDSAEELHKYDDHPYSMTFIPSKLEDNPELLDKNPGYKTMLKSLPEIERRRLLEGNWHVRGDAGSYFKASWFTLRERPLDPSEFKRVVRYWDRAATEPNPTNSDPDYTVGLLLGIKPDKTVTVIDVLRFRKSPAGVLEEIRKATIRDLNTGWPRYVAPLEVDPAQAGKVERSLLSRELGTLPIKWVYPKGDKEKRALPASAAAEAGNIEIMKADWNNAFLAELQTFPEGKHDDQVDAFTGAYNFLVDGGHGIFV